jgi:hypothetical protein
MVGAIWDRALKESLGVRRDQTLAIALSEVKFALEGHRRRADILEGFHARGSLRPRPEGTWLTAPVEH